jgi:DNA-binding transcriptional regulator YdaS (Cro superfamily)
MAKVANGLGISRAAVSLWTKVPAEMVVEVEKITGIPREQLRPDLYREGALSA